MLSALTVLLLGCWLAGHSAVWGEPSYPKPNISLLSPSWGVSLGGAVTILCCGQHEGLQFVLNKEGRRVQIVNSDYLALFHINNVSREDGGNYSCSYHNQSEPSAVSDSSDPMELAVRDPSLPRPNISLNFTAPGADVTIRCQVQRRDVRFFLHKAGHLKPQQRMDSAGAWAEFCIPTVGRQHGGSYSCSYRPWSEPFISSEPSDPVEIIAADESSPPGLTVITGVSVAAAILLLLLVAFVCFRKTRARRGAASRPNSTSPMGALKVPAQEEHIYTNIDEWKETQTL
ncbi:immunoglobulin superfamily member 1-like isoform X1 [Mauremys mutica]|uniref:immunoglobulin superfamily member 1-like isoform X1 n=1 Tax=Mauremys mutica TaxID=74926 RepID=UPI001D16BFBE|nr:immunoglobulin superfamily member 1-like isoform X1 [Mauremys mutica]